MKGTEFIRLLKRLARSRGIHLEIVSERGKGSHRTLYFGDHRTILRDPKDELKKGTLHAMLKQLNLDLEDLYR